MWFVTGASGFVGRHVLAALGERGRPVLRGDVGTWNADNLARVMAGATGVVHAASVVHKPGTPAAEYEAFNVEGTRAVLDAAARVGARRVVFVSSIKVYGEAPVGTIDEATPALPEAHYAETKLRAEGLVLARPELAPVVLRLCPVYGVGDKGNVRTMIRAIQRRRFLLPGDGSTRKSIVHVSTVAAVARAALEATAGGVFVVADRRAPSLRELAEIIAARLGRRRPIGVPAWLLRTAAGAVGGVARRLAITTPISSTLIDKALTSSVCDPGRVERELGVPCTVDLAQKIDEEIAWLRAIGAL